MNITQINTAILQNGFTNDELTSIIDAVRFARARLTERNKRSLRYGDEVSFTSSKTGRTMQGSVISSMSPSRCRCWVCGECLLTCLH